MTIEVNGKTLDTDEEGYLANLADWEPGVADVMAVVEAEAELAQHRRHLELLKDRLPRLQETKLELEEQLARAAEVIDVVQHTHALASIEAKHYDGTRLDG